MTFETLTVERDGAIATVSINRPKALNALNAAVLGELDALVSALAADESLRAVILTGAGDRSFVAGADIPEMKGLGGPEAAAFSRRGQAVFSAIEALEVPVIAAINGFALGGGLELALCAHIRVAARTAKLGLPEVTLGLIPGYGGTQRLPRLIGRGPALELILTGAFVDAERAAALGLVNRVVDPEHLTAETRALADAIAKVGPRAVSAALGAVRRGLDLPLSEGLGAEADAFGALFETRDAAEGIAAFMEKRKPAFDGR